MDGDPASDSAPPSAPGRLKSRAMLLVLGLSVTAIVLPMLFDDAREAPLTLEPLVVEAPARDVPRFETLAPDSDVAAAAGALRDSVDANGFAVADGTRFGEPKLLAVTDETTVWAVHVDTVAELELARQVRETLRERGFEAFLSTRRRANGEVVTDVAIGPFLDRADAEATAGQMDARFVPSLKEFRP